MYMGVDQNKGIWSSYNRREKPRINRDPNGGPNGVNRGRVLLYATLLCAANRQNVTTIYYIL